MSDGGGHQRRRRGIYLLPNLFTTAALFAGFYAIIAAVGGRFTEAAAAIFVAMVLDGVDGRVARLTNTQSAFGTEYDSLADMVSFGVAPALVTFLWLLHDTGNLGWLAAFVYTAGAALRLARFNAQVATADKRYFQGLPSPAAAALIAGLVWLGASYEEPGLGWTPLAIVLLIAAGLLMVSNFRYHSFKQLDMRGRVPFMTLLVVVLLFVLIALDPPQILFAGFLLYAMSGPVLTLLHLRRHRQERRGSDDGAPPSS